MVDGGASAARLETTDDALLDGRVTLRQPAAGYRAAIDPVLLAAAVPARPSERVLDLGCGVGAAALCLLARVARLEAVGLELQAPLAELARHNAAANGAPLRVATGDVAAPPADLGSGYDRVFLNPPFNPVDADASPLPRKDVANREGAASLAVWLDLAVRRCRAGGTVTLIHRPERLSAVLAALEGRAGDLRVLPLYPGGAADPPKPARRIVVQATVGRAGPLRLLPGLALHAPGGGFGPRVEAVLRGRAALSLGGA